ncbi:hypothetical protein HRbin27_01710 [bacterium HR27]|nr:hypothetical protein HRbin27_01710 [bacterium HR27]
MFEPYPVVDRADPAQRQVSDRLPLAPADADQPLIGKPTQHPAGLRHIQPPMERGDRRRRHTTREGEGEVIDMRVDDVELVGPGVHLLEHRHVERDRILGAEETQPPFSHRHQARAGLRIGRREERHVVPAPDQLLDERVHDTFRPTVQLGRYRFEERRDLRDPHASSLRP